MSDPRLFACDHGKPTPPSQKSNAVLMLCFSEVDSPAECFILSSISYGRKFVIIPIPSVCGCILKVCGSRSLSISAITNRGLHHTSNLPPWRPVAVCSCLHSRSRGLFRVTTTVELCEEDDYFQMSLSMKNRRSTFFSRLCDVLTRNKIKINIKSGVTCQNADQIQQRVI